MAVTHEDDVWEKAKAMFDQQQREGADQRLQAAEQRAENWQKVAEQAFTPTKAGAWLMVLAGLAIMLAVFGQMGLWVMDRASERSPAVASVVGVAPTSTPTPLQRDIEAFSGRQSASVVAPAVGRDEGDEYSFCPAGFPIVAASYGAYYMPGDALFGQVQASVWLALCFASVDAAEAAGYTRAPSGLLK